MYPLPSNKPESVNVYGVIIEYSESRNELIIQDDTEERVTLTLVKRNPKPGQPPKELPLVAGDIVRIHRLMLHPCYTRRCPAIHNLVVRSLLVFSLCTERDCDFEESVIKIPRLGLVP